LDLPEPTKWNCQFNVLEKYTYEAVQQVKETSQLQAAEDESLATVMEETNAIEQNLLEEEVPFHRIQASFDMGWQVRSSGHKYASPTGHGLLIGALTKKVLDSVIYNKKSGTCTNTTHNMVHPTMLRDMNAYATMREHRRRWRRLP
jgi:hypothetical protein